uniref:CCHC-type domain-containing protein n=1 Tax=Meloidogyne hapla TaxID=6305 RepID=A0A1I8B6A3_MELHA
MARVCPDRNKCRRCSSTDHYTTHCPRKACFCCARSGHTDKNCWYVCPSARALMNEGQKPCYNCGSVKHSKGSCDKPRYLPMPLRDLILRNIKLPREYIELEASELELASAGVQKAGVLIY